MKACMHLFYYYPVVSLSLPSLPLFPSVKEPLCPQLREANSDNTDLDQTSDHPWFRDLSTICKQLETPDTANCCIARSYQLNFNSALSCM